MKMLKITKDWKLDSALLLLKNYFMLGEGSDFFWNLRQKNILDANPWDMVSSYPCDNYPQE